MSDTRRGSCRSAREAPVLATWPAAAEEGHGDRRGTGLLTVPRKLRVDRHGVTHRPRCAQTPDGCRHVTLSTSADTSEYVVEVRTASTQPAIGSPANTCRLSRPGGTRIPLAGDDGGCYWRLQR